MWFIEEGDQYVWAFAESNSWARAGLTLTLKDGWGRVFAFVPRMNVCGGFGNSVRGRARVAKLMFLNRLTVSLSVPRRTLKVPEVLHFSSAAILNS